MARRNRSLKLLRLARDKKSLIWQKRYLTKLLEQQYYKNQPELSENDSILRNDSTTSSDLKVRHKI